MDEDFGNEEIAEEDGDNISSVPGKVNQEDLINEAKSFFNTQRKQLGESAKSSEKIVKVNFDEISEQSPELAERLIISPEETIQVLELALHEAGLISNARVHIRTNSSTQKMKIGKIRSMHFDTLISLEGKIISISKLYPKCISARFECPACGCIMSVLQLEDKIKEPSRCSCGRRNNFKELSREIIDFFEIVLMDTKTKNQLTIEFDESFLGLSYENVFRNGNIIAVNGFFRFTGKEKIEGYDFYPRGVDLIKEDSSGILNIEEYLEALRKKGRDGATEFENFVGDLFRKKGFSVKVTKASGDFGIDVVAEKDKEKIAIQCKLFSIDNKIDAKSVQMALGSCVSPYDATKVIFVTTASGYTPQAMEQIKTSKIPLELWNREKLILEAGAFNDDLDEAWGRLNKLEEEKMKNLAKESFQELSFDIDKIGENPAFKRNKIFQLKEIINQLEEKVGKLIPIEEIEKMADGKMNLDEIKEAIDKLTRAGDLFRPRKGYVQRM